MEGLVLIIAALVGFSAVMVFKPRPPKFHLKPDDDDDDKAGAAPPPDKPRRASYGAARARNKRD